MSLVIDIKFNSNSIKNIKSIYFSIIDEKKFEFFLQDKKMKYSKWHRIFDWFSSLIKWDLEIILVLVWCLCLCLVSKSKSKSWWLLIRMIIKVIDFSSFIYCSICFKERRKTKFFFLSKILNRLMRNVKNNFLFYFLSFLKWFE